MAGVGGRHIVTSSYQTRIGHTQPSHLNLAGNHNKYLGTFIVIKGNCRMRRSQTHHQHLLNAAWYTVI